MKILALEFSSDRRSVALIDDGKVLGSAVEQSVRQTQAAGLVHSVFGQTNFRAEALDGIVIGLGPGSNAGIRASIAFALGLHLAHRIRLAGMPSTELMAAGCWLSGARGPVDVAVDAQRGDYYLGGFEVSEVGWVESDQLRIVASDEIARRITIGRTVVGPDAALESKGGQRLFPAAGDLACMAFDKLRWVEGNSLAPIYLRESNFAKAPLARTYT